MRRVFALLPGEARSKRSRTRSTRSGTCRLSKQDALPLGGGGVGMRADGLNNCLPDGVQTGRKFARSVLIEALQRFSSPPLPKDRMRNPGTLIL